MARSWLAALLVMGLAAPPAMAQALVIDAPSARDLPASGGLLVDIRTPAEVAATGRPAGAIAVPLQGDDRTFRSGFAAEVKAAAGDDPARPIALIDANGRRAEFAAKLLASQGFASLFVVGEGMLGSNLGPGWLARGLPLER
jgi:rhodanese-related sulfurtransferase